MKHDKKIARYRGCDIWQCEDGFYWSEGGYTETIRECETEIDDHHAYLAESFPLMQDDTPCPRGWDKID